MSDWYEVYDNEQVQQRTRKQVGRIVLGVIIGLSAMAVILPLMLFQFGIPAAVIILVGLAVLVLVAAASRELLQLRRVTWCVKVSVHRIVGYDYARRKAVIPWPDVERVDVEPDGLLIVGRPTTSRPPVLQIPTLFPEFPHLSHRIVEYAEAHGIPICVDGRPWQLLDLSTLYPFMAGLPVMERPGGPASDAPDEPTV